MVLTSQAVCPRKSGNATDVTVDENSELLAALIGRVQMRDEAALGELYDATVNRLYGLALRMMRNPHDAEEIVSRVYTQVWDNAASFDKQRGKVLSWLLVICRSRALDCLRMRDRAEPCEHIDELADLDSEAARDPFSLLDGKRRETAVRHALRQLTAEQRDLIALAFFRGYTHEEIAVHRQQALGTVKSGIRRALLQMRAALAGSGLDSGADWEGSET